MAAGRFEKDVFSQCSLGRLGSHGAPSEAAEQRQTRSITDKTNTVKRNSSVFSLEETDGDIFDIDNDIFSDASSLLLSSTSGTDTSAAGHKPLRSPSTTSPANSLPNPTANHQVAKDSSSSAIGVAPRAHGGEVPRPKSFSPSPRSLEKLRSFTRPSTQKRSEPSSEFNPDPPAKRVNTSVTLTENHEDFFDKDLLMAFMSESDHVEPSTSISDRSASQTSQNQPMPSTVNTSQSSFKAPKSHPRKGSTSCQFNGGVAPRSHPLGHFSHTPAPLTPSSSRTPTPLTPSTPQNLPASTSSTDVRARSFCSKSTPSHPSIRTSATNSFLSPALSGLSTPQCGRRMAPVRRRFPGPAGILPALSIGQSLDGVVIRTPSLPTPASTPQLQILLATPASRFNSISCQSFPQDEDDFLDFSQGPWVTMLQDLDMNDGYSAPLLKFTIARAIQQASRHRLRNGKVAHLRVIVKSIVPAPRNTSAVLKDPSGEMLCTIHQSVMKEHRHTLHPRAVLILRQVTVFSPAPRKHYLNITPDNIVIIYPSSTSGKTTPTAPRTICLTEIEKRFQDQAAKENSPWNSPRLSSTPVTSARGHRDHAPQSLHQETAQAPGRQGDGVRHRESSTSTPGLILGDSVSRQDGHVSDSTHHPTTDSFFSDQLCDDEFDSIMNCLGSDLDF